MTRLTKERLVEIAEGKSSAVPKRPQWVPNIIMATFQLVFKRLDDSQQKKAPQLSVCTINERCIPFRDSPHKSCNIEFLL